MNSSGRIVGVSSGWQSTTLSVFDPVRDGFIEFSNTGTGAEETSGKVKFGVKLFRAQENSGLVTVQYQTHDQSANAGKDYTAKSGVLQWAPGEEGEKIISVSIQDNLTFDWGLERAFNMTLSSPTGAQLGKAIESTAFISDGFPTLEVRNQIDTSVGYGVVVKQGTRQAILQLERSGNLDGKMIVTNLTPSTFFTQLKDGVDFAFPKNPVLIWAPGEGGVKTVTIPLLKPNEPISQFQIFAVFGDIRIEGSEFQNNFSVSVILVPGDFVAEPELLTETATISSQGLKFSARAIQGSSVRLEARNAAENGSWTVIEEKTAADGTVEFQIPINSEVRHRFFRVSAR